MSHISQKPEKIASAIYLITSFFNDQEPAKWKLRALASEFVTVSVSLTSQMFKEREAARLEARSIIWETISIMSVLKNAGLISEPNFNLLYGELVNYVQILGFPAGLEEQNGAAVLSSNYFGIANNRTLNSGSENNQNVVKDKNFETESVPRKDVQKQEESDIYQGRNLLGDGPINSYKNSEIPSFKADTKPEKKDKSFKEFGAVSVKKNSRQSAIIGLLKRKKEIMIKDVSPLISGCSEKTIQRELSAMVQAGILRKMGEKRWSRYTLA